jgi:DNA-binding transcriptional LysR family regulator
VSLSDAGRRLLDSARPAIDRLREVERVGAALKAGSSEPAIRISATEPIISHVLMPALPRLFAAGPMLIEMLTATAVADFDRHECDIAVRLFRPTGDTLVARRMPDIAIGLFAADRYLAGRDPADLSLDCEVMLVMSDSYGQIAEVQWAMRQGIHASAMVRSSSSMGLLQAARAGVGIALAPSFLAQNLIPIPAFPIPPRQCWLVSHTDTRRTPRHRRVLDWAAESLTRSLNTQLST